jgi:hypothetical protein
VTLTDRQGNSDIVPVEMSVANVPPVAYAGPDQMVTEGSAVNLHGTFMDPGTLDTHSFLWHVTSPNGQTIPDGTSQDFSFTPSHSGTYTVAFTVTDSEGASGTSTMTVTVQHVPPTLSLNGPGQVDEGNPYTLGLQSYETGTEVIQSWTINWGDGSSPQTVTGNPSTVIYVYNVPGTYTISATATDDVGTYNAGNTETVIVNNLPPTITASISYGGLRSVTISGQVMDSSPAGLTVTLSGMVTGTTITDANGFYTFTVDASGLGQVLVSTVDAGGLASNVAQVTVACAAPQINDFLAQHLVFDFWTVSGTVNAPDAASLVITLGGLLSLANVQVTVQSDGSFTYTWELANPFEAGIVTAVTTDCWGQQSNIATYLVVPS